MLVIIGCSHLLIEMILPFDPAIYRQTREGKDKKATEVNCFKVNQHLTGFCTACWQGIEPFCTAFVEEKFIRKWVKIRETARVAVSRVHSLTQKHPSWRSNWFQERKNSFPSFITSSHFFHLVKNAWPMSPLLEVLWNKYLLLKF